ncbi:MAG: alpha/beta hydrolase [Maribacter sp.]|nr:alpha/beta hydrolase [Maribacter sp.]
MNRILSVFALGVFFFSSAQEITLKKGAITESVKVNDSTSESFALYLPTNFDTRRPWPVVFVFDMNGKGVQAISMFKGAAEEQGYILATSNDIADSLSLSQNMLICARMFNSVYNLLPIGKNRTYTAGFSGGGRFSSLVPSFIKNVKGVISCGASISNTDVLSVKTPFHFIGIVGREDYNYPELLSLEPTLDQLKYPNQILVFEGGHEWPPKNYLSKSLAIMSLAAMANNDLPRNSIFIEKTYAENLGEISTWMTLNKPLLAENEISEMIEVFAPLKNIDSLKLTSKTIKKSALFKPYARNEKAVLFKESLIREEFNYYLSEDIITYNYNNLGWWQYQMDQLEKYNKSNDPFEQQMGKRLHGYINALVEDNIDVIKLETAPLDLEALNFLYMLKTITAPNQYDAYLKVISNSSLMEDYGTALYYLEELLKKGYADRTALQELEYAGLLRITPEYMALLEKYWK